MTPDPAALIEKAQPWQGWAPPGTVAHLVCGLRDALEAALEENRQRRVSLEDGDAMIQRLLEENRRLREELDAIGPMAQHANEMELELERAEAVVEAARVLDFGTGRGYFTEEEERFMKALAAYDEARGGPG